MSDWESEEIKVLRSFLIIGWHQFFWISKKGIRTKFLLCIILCGKFNFPFNNNPLKSIISISHSLGAFLMDFFLPKFISILLHKWSNSLGFCWQKAFKTTFINLGFLGFGHEGTERSANEAAKIAEKIYKPITDLYQFYPNSKTSIIVKDTDDIANGAAYYFDAFMDYRVGGTEVSAKGKVIIQKLIKGENVDVDSSGLSKREWNELMIAFDLKDKLI